jgi:hypothetical protein
MSTPAYVEWMTRDHGAAAPDRFSSRRWTLSRERRKMRAATVPRTLEVGTMQERRLVGATILIALTAMACGTASGTPPPAPSPSPTASLGGGGGGGGGGASNPASPSGASTPASSASVGPTPSLSDVDPCTLLGESDASTLIGTTVLHTQGGGAGTKAPCVYGNSNHDSVAVAIRLAPDAAAAGQLMTAQMNSMKAEGFTVTPVDLGDPRVTTAYEAKKKSSGIVADGIYVQDGVTFFYVTTLSKTLDPADDAFKTAAGVALGHL